MLQILRGSEGTVLQNPAPLPLKDRGSNVGNHSIQDAFACGKLLGSSKVRDVLDETENSVCDSSANAFQDPSQPCLPQDCNAQLPPSLVLPSGKVCHPVSRGSVLGGSCCTTL